MQDRYITDRLILKSIAIDDHEFIKNIVNSPSWIKFIGDKNIKSNDDAKKYIKDIINNSNCNFWTINIQDQHTPIGLVSFMQRENFEYHDIGYALLENFTKQGFAYEAVSRVLHDIVNNHTHHKIIIAKTFTNNHNSLKLLNKLGFLQNNEIVNPDDDALIFSASLDRLSISYLTAAFFDLFTNSDNRRVELDKIKLLCVSDAVIIRVDLHKGEIFDINSFIGPRQRILSDGTLTNFKEYEIYEETKIISNLAQRVSKYRKSGFLNGKYFDEKGNKIFQYVKIANKWKIISIIWKDEV